MEQMELFEEPVRNVGAELLISVVLPAGSYVLRLEEAKVLHTELDKYKHLWSVSNGR